MNETKNYGASVMSTSTNRRQRRAAGHNLSKRIINELAERAETTGCDHCGCRFGEFVRYLIAARPTGGFTVRCPNCLDGVIPILAGACFGGGDPWSNDDRAWFVAHPTRRWRLRELMPGEGQAPAPPGWQPAVAVCQHAPGVRSRHSVALRGSDPLDSYTDAGIATLIQGLAGRAAETAALSEEECRRMQQERIAARLEALAQELAP